MIRKIQAIQAGYREQIALEAEQGSGLRKGELLRLTGPAIFLDRISGNGRKYIPESVRACVADLQPRIAKKALFGCLDHPMTDDINQLAYVKMTDVSHRVDALWYDKATNSYMITITVLDTPNGRILKTLYDSGSPLYVSLRSLLDPSRNVPHDGYTDCFMLALITIDAVSRPGFADAELQAVDVSNESLQSKAMLAVCESLNLFKSQRIFDMKRTKNRRSNRQNFGYRPVISLESISGVATQPSDDFRKVVNDFIVDMLDKLPGVFEVKDFAAEYPDSMFTGHIVGLYETTHEVIIKDAASSTVALIELDSDVDGKYSIASDAEVSYFNTEVADNSKAAEPAEEHYAIIATEDYEPAAGFIETAQSVANYMRDNYGDGFTQDEFNTEIAEALNNQFGVVARIDDKTGDEYELKLTSADGNDAASLLLNKEDDKFMPGQISEYWQPGTESYEVGKCVCLKDASDDCIASGEIEASGTFGELRDTIENEDEEGFNNMITADIADDTEVIKIGGNWYFVDNGMTVDDCVSAATEACAVGDDIALVEESEDGSQNLVDRGIVQEFGTVGDFRDQILNEDPEATEAVDCADDDQTCVKVNESWYVLNDTLQAVPADECDLVEDPASANEDCAVGDDIALVEENEDGEQELIDRGIVQECGVVSDLRDTIIAEDPEATEACDCADDDATAIKVNENWYILNDKLQAVPADECDLVENPEAGNEGIVKFKMPVCVNGTVIPAGESLKFNAEGFAKYAGKQISIYDFPTACIANESLDGVTKQTDGNQPTPVKLDDGYMSKGDLAAGDGIKAEIVEDEDELDKDNKEAVIDGMYEVIEGDNAEIVDDDDPDNPDGGEKKDDDPDSGDRDTAGNDDLSQLATEAQRIFNMPNNKFAGNYAIEHMPAAYKHIWGGLSDAAKTLIATRAKDAKIATEAACLDFWKNTNFIAIERACIINSGKVEAAMEHLRIEDPRTAFIKGLIRKH